MENSAVCRMETHAAQRQPCSSALQLGCYRRARFQRLNGPESLRQHHEMQKEEEDGTCGHHSFRIKFKLFHAVFCLDNLAHTGFPVGLHTCLPAAASYRVCVLSWEQPRSGLWFPHLLTWPPSLQTAVKFSLDILLPFIQSLLLSHSQCEIHFSYKQASVLKCRCGEGSPLSFI